MKNIIDNLRNSFAMTLPLIGWKDQCLINVDNNPWIRLVKGGHKVKQRHVPHQRIPLGRMFLKEIQDFPKPRVLIGNVLIVCIFNEPQGQFLYSITTSCIVSRVSNDWRQQGSWRERRSFCLLFDLLL
jgi:hypothetical protein